MDTWRFIDSGSSDAAYNMALDEAISASVRNGDAPPTLRLYGWKRLSISLGSFQKISDIDEQYCEVQGIAVVRRPTGGRAILHGDELTYSFCSKNDGFFSHGLLDSYLQLSSALRSAVTLLGLEVEMKMKRESGRTLIKSPLCFNSASFGEICFDKKKLIGSAQKRWPESFLQQGSIPYTMDYERITAVINPSNRTHSNVLQDSMVGLKELRKSFDEEVFKRYIRTSFEKTFSISLVAAHPSAREQEAAHQLSLLKYSNPHWTRSFPERRKTGHREAEGGPS